jgi:hypothetical protein
MLLLLLLLLLLLYLFIVILLLYATHQHGIHNALRVTASNDDESANKVDLKIEPHQHDVFIHLITY